MRNLSVAILVVMVALTGGCVWKSDYTARLTDIDGLKKDKTRLEERIADQENRIAALTSKSEDLEREKQALTEQNDAIKTTLESSRDDLVRQVVMLKNSLNDNKYEIARLKSEIDKLNEETIRAIGEKEHAMTQMKNTYESLMGELKQEIKEGEIQITQLKDRLTVNMVDKILFDSGSAIVKPKGQKVLNRVAEILKSVTDRQIRVEGHTDNVPISAALAEKFPTNWELSTARATTVVRYLQGRGIDPALLSAEGFSEYRPVVPNDSSANKTKNRRIEIVLVPLEAK
jgi:chemotaxis protein MotB